MCRRRLLVDIKLATLNFSFWSELSITCSLSLPFSFFRSKCYIKKIIFVFRKWSALYKNLFAHQISPRHIINLVSNIFQNKSYFRKYICKLTDHFRWNTLYIHSISTYVTHACVKKKVFLDYPYSVVAHWCTDVWHKLWVSTYIWYALYGIVRILISTLRDLPSRWRVPSRSCLQDVAKSRSIFQGRPNPSLPLLIFFVCAIFLKSLPLLLSALFNPAFNESSHLIIVRRSFSWCNRNDLF